MFSSFETIEDLPFEEQMELFSELQESGFAGVEPALPLGWTVPEDALYNLSEEDKEEGVSASY